MLEVLFHYSFLQHALISSVLISVVVGIIGPLILEKKMVMTSAGLAHSAFGGIGLGYLLQFPPIYGGLLFAILSSLGIGRISDQQKEQSDVLTGVFWSMSMALGILFIAFAPGYPPTLSSYLFGNILAVTDQALGVMILLTLIVIFMVIALFQRFKAFLFDQEFAQVQGENTKWLGYILYFLVGISVVVLIRVVGLVLMIGLLTAPVAIAKKLTYNFKHIMLWSVGISLIASLLGLWISYQWNIASGASITLLIGTAYFLTLGLVQLKKKLILLKQARGVVDDGR